MPGDLLSRSLSRSHWGRPKRPAEGGGGRPGPASAESCPDTPLSGNPGRCFTEVEVVTSEFLQMYKIHISVHICGGVSSQAEGKWPARDRRPPRVCPASGPRKGWGICSPGDLGGCQDAHGPGKGPVPSTGRTQPVPQATLGHRTGKDTAVPSPPQPIDST